MSVWERKRGIHKSLLWSYVPSRKNNKTVSAFSINTVWTRISLLTLSKKTLHLLTCLIIVDEDIEAQALEAFEQLTSVSVCAVAYIHPCQDIVFIIHSTCIVNWIRYPMCSPRLPYLSSHQSFCCWWWYTCPLAGGSSYTGMLVKQFCNGFQKSSPALASGHPYSSY